MSKYEIGQEISVSMLLKITGMDIRPNGSVSYHTNYGMTFPESIIEQTERQKTTPPEAAQNKPTPEPIKLYCVKDFMPGTYATKGKIYEMQKMFVDNRIKFDNGRIERWSSVEGICFDGENVFGKYLVPLVSRPAKVGEWVYIVKEDGAHMFPIKNGEIYKVVLIDDWGNHPFNLSTQACVKQDEYLVLDGYQPEPEQPKVDKKAEWESVIREVKAVAEAQERKRQEEKAEREKEEQDRERKFEAFKKLYFLIFGESND